MGHSNTVLAQMVKIIPRHEFEKLAADRFEVHCAGHNG